MAQFEVKNNQQKTIGTFQADFFTIVDEGKTLHFYNREDHPPILVAAMTGVDQVTVRRTEK